MYMMTDKQKQHMEKFTHSANGSHKIFVECAAEGEYEGYTVSLLYVKGELVAQYISDVGYIFDNFIPTEPYEYPSWKAHMEACGVEFVGDDIIGWR